MHDTGVKTVREDSDSGILLYIHTKATDIVLVGG